MKIPNLNKPIYLLLQIFLMICLVQQVLAVEKLDYQLEPEQIAEDTYVFIGAKEDFSYENGGNIVNTGFIVTEQGVVVIDSGPSKRYGQQMREAISKVTNKPIIKILITHHHPDHFLGNQAFQDVPIYALAETIKLIKRDGDGFLDNLYRMSGPWMSGTDFSVVEIKALVLKQEKIANHTLKYFKFGGHTSADLVILDESTGVLFTGDLVFHNRTLTTPHADPENWLKSLDKIKAIDFNIIVPGHGEVANNIGPIEQTRDYLVWLESTIKQAVEHGLDMTEVLALPIPERFGSFGVLKREYIRSVSHRYPVYEKLIFN
ncbi:MAG: quinoprotein relay system zinc metallohydrolase 1 [Proteobacteria bacterium]|nr:quinoprotein relay system zinc metallohydrolase 1 [Pseudomonadota bacterium]NOG61752.1 quinoprotein relay system zinc metallohydrolase 1 [Pseudomonadota bacterium]